MLGRSTLCGATLALSLVVGSLPVALADEVTTTTKTTKTGDPAVVVGVPGVVGVEVGKAKPDCTNKTVTKTDSDGDTTKKSSTSCD